MTSASSSSRRPGKDLRGQDPKKLQAAIGAEVKTALGHFAEIRMPDEAEEPILAPSVRAALHEWRVEIANADLLEAVGVKARRCVLLYGPPGTGKTTFAHHFAARLGLPLAMVQSESMVGKYLGETQNNIGQLFNAMKRVEGKCVVFFDEFDSLAAKREDNGSGAGREMMAALNVMLRRIERQTGLVLAATNRRSAIDEAMWRRFHMQIEIGLPGDEERFAIIKRYGAPFDLDDDDVDLLVGLTGGASPALLRAFIENAKRAIVMAPKLRRNIDDPAAFFAGIVAAVAPHPDIEPPILWQGEATDSLSGLQWPWSIPQNKDEAA